MNSIRDSVRKRPAMYFGDTSSRGAMHMVEERM
ncbi:MAG: hypothetical protein RL095_2636 [Verrucomicrobiota bacterium]